MRVTPEHLAILRAAIEPLDTEGWRNLYRTRNIPRGNDVKDIDRRYRWDLYYAAAREHNLAGGSGLPDSTSGYNMNHIDTALRAIVPPLGTESTT